MLNNNIILNTDSYKLSHWELYPEKMHFLSSYIEPRGPANQHVLFFGLQMLLDTLQAPTEENIEEALDLIPDHGFNMNIEGWRALKKKGFLPLEIYALPEGTIAPVSVPQIQIRNTDPNFSWLVSYLETALIRATWYPSTVATNSYNIKKMMYRFLEDTCEDPDSAINFMLHDFGARAASSNESAGIGGAAHLVNFMGTDTVQALRYVRKYYGMKVAGFSIPATEHSVSTAYGSHEGERVYIERALSKIENGSPLAAIVADTYDLYNFVDNLIGKDYKERIERLPGRLVIRPDSGDPTVVPIKVIESLGRSFGFATNSKGYKVLPNYIRVIQGDGVEHNSIHKILSRLKEIGWSAENIVFGMGGKLLGQPQRDDFKYAQKANEVQINGKRIEVFKNPATDSGKASKAGRQAVIKKNGVLTSVKEAGLFSMDENKLELVWRDGLQTRHQSFENVRALANSAIIG